MRRTIWLAGLMAATLAGVTVAARTAYADDSQAPSGDNGKPSMGQGTDPGPDGGMMGGDQMDKMKEKLGLTDDQVSKLKNLFKSQMEANKPLRDQMKIDMDTLQQKVDMKASDGDIQKLLDKLDGEQKEMQASREKMKDQWKAILTPTQQAKMVLGMQKRGMGMMKKMWNQRHGKGNAPGNGGGNPPPGGNAPAQGGNAGSDSQ